MSVRSGVAIERDVVPIVRASPEDLTARSRTQRNGLVIAARIAQVRLWVAMLVMRMVAGILALLLLTGAVLLQ